MSARDKIIDAAMAIVREQGVGRLTLDEAAKVAGLSKGGVLYHFKGKDDLVAGMIGVLVARWEELHHGYYLAEPEGAYRWARAVVRAAFDPNGPANDPIGGALLAAMSNNRALMAPMQAKYEEWTGRMREDSPDPERAILVCMAMDGYLFERMMGLDLCNCDQAARIRDYALALLNDGEGGR
ncbi:MAG: TetR/AcrR family transcriptional regulator [Magnetospirillum sp.]|nr:TetR/AcrR family transcriptional regulator [Magnetospirillum sp.]